jgi:hypothetical protein
VITESEAGPYLRPSGADTIDLRSALEGHQVVLFSLNSSRYGKFASQLGTLVVQDLVCASGMRLETTASRAPALVAIDEFSGIGGEHVVALFARGREAGVQVVVATQEMADLDRAARGVRDQVLGSTALKLILRQDVPESAHTVAQLAGTERVWEETQQVSGGLLFRGPPARGTRREVERFVIHPNQIKSLRTGEAVLISKLRGEPPQVVRVSPAPAVAAAAPARRTSWLARSASPPERALSPAEHDGFSPTVEENRSASRSKRRQPRSSARGPQSPSPRGYDPGVTR